MNVLHREDCRLIAITPPTPVSDADMLDRCLAAEAGGATLIQIRLKGIGAGELVRRTERLRQELTVPVYVNDRLDVALAAAAAGAHIGADDLPAHGLRRVAPRPFGIGISVGDESEASAGIHADADYWSVGPFFPTSMKPDAGPALGPSGFRRLARLAPRHVPVVAIGGIDAANTVDVMRAGAYGIAAIGAVFERGDVERATRVLRDAVDAAFPAPPPTSPRDG